MKTAAVLALALAVTAVALGAQDTKPVPKDSMRVSVMGCAKGYVFTAGPPVEGQTDSADIAEGMHLRMNGEKKLVADIKAHEGSMIVITGLMRKGQTRPGGVAIGGNVRVTPGPMSQGGGGAASLAMIDIEGWRQTPLECKSR